MFHDEAVFPDHETFRPERWMDGTLLENHDVDPLDIQFGFGRRYAQSSDCTSERRFDEYFVRTCPGKYLAIEVLFTTIASTLAVFNISPAKDTNGVAIIPKEAFTLNAVVYVYVLHPLFMLRMLTLSFM